MPENNNAERFLNAYSTIEHEMERILDLKDHRRFFELVDKSSRINPVIERYRFDLREYSELRNAIVHDRSGGEIIAVPTNEVVDKIERIAALLVEPPKVAPRFLKEVLSLSGHYPVSRAVRELSKRSYTQAPVYVNGKLIGLLTSNMIVKWMGICLINNQEEVNLHETSLTDVIKKAGHENDYQFVSVNQSLFDVPDLFYHWQHEGRKLEAVLITQNGDPAEPLLGIITNRDLPAVHREIDQSSAAAEKSKA